jgi:hypothetical protein
MPFLFKPIIDPARKYHESHHSGLGPESSPKLANNRVFERAGDTGFRRYDVYTICSRGSNKHFMHI